MSTTRFPSRLAAYEAGRKAGAQEERERLAAQGKQNEQGDDSDRLTLEAVRAGKYTHDELIARKDEVDALLSGETP